MQRLAIPYGLWFEDLCSRNKVLCLNQKLCFVAFIRREKYNNEKIKAWWDGKSICVSGKSRSLYH